MADEPRWVEPTRRWIAIALWLFVAGAIVVPYVHGRVTERMYYDLTNACRYIGQYTVPLKGGVTIHCTLEER